MLEAVLVISILFFAIYMAGQIDITNLEREARKYWRKDVS